MPVYRADKYISAADVLVFGLKQDTYFEIIIMTVTRKLKAFENLASGKSKFAI